MPLAISDIIKRAAVRCSLEEPTGTIFSSTDKDIKLLLEMAVETGEELRDECFFPQLKRTHTITTTTATKYPLPGDFWRIISGTTWDQTNSWNMDGPQTDQVWSLWQYGAVDGASSRKKFKIFGSNFDAGQFFVDPAFSASQTFSFDYIRSEWFMPKRWTTGESVTSGTTYRFASGNLYLAQTTATTGATVPSHTTGTASDGTVSWLYVVTQVYTTTGKFLADTDIPLIDEDLLLKGIVWRFKELKGFEYGEVKGQYLQQKMKRLTRITGAPILSMSGGSGDWDNVPERDFGY